jgi:hypothetical protein
LGCRRTAGAACSPASKAPMVACRYCADGGVPLVPCDTAMICVCMCRGCVEGAVWCGVV